MKFCTLTACGALAAASVAPALADTLVVNSYGGPYEPLIEERIIKPFEEKTGIDVVYDAVGSSSQDFAKIKATGGRPGFDVVVMTASQSLQGCDEGLLEKFDTTKVPNLAKLNPKVSEMAGPCGAVHEIQYLSLLWRTDKLAQAPDSWMVLADPALADKIILPSFFNIMATNLIQVLSVANGGDMYENVEPGFEALKKIAANTLGFEQSSAIMEKFLRDGQAVAMASWSGRAQLMVDEGLPVEYTRPKEGSIPLIATLNIPAGSQNKEAAFKFVDFFLEKAQQEAWVTGYQVGSIRNDIEVPAEVRARQITTEADLEGLLLPDLRIVTEKMRDWGSRWEREVVPAAN